MTFRVSIPSVQNQSQHLLAETVIYLIYNMPNTMTILVTRTMETIFDLNGSVPVQTASCWFTTSVPVY
jgi:hypothetical protein